MTINPTKSELNYLNSASPLQLAHPGLTQPSLLELRAVPAGTKRARTIAYSHLQPLHAFQHVPYVSPKSIYCKSHLADLMDRQIFSSAVRPPAPLALHPLAQEDGDLPGRLLHHTNCNL